MEKAYRIIIIMLVIVLCSNPFISSNTGSQKNTERSNFEKRMELTPDKIIDTRSNDNGLLHPAMDREQLVMQSYGDYFTANHGQVDNDDIRFYIHGKGIWFRSNEIIIEYDMQNRFFIQFNFPDFLLARSVPNSASMKFQQFAEA